MTAIGEETGRLDDVMESLSAHYQREESLSRNIRNSLSYPLIMIIMMLVVIVIPVSYTHLDQTTVFLVGSDQKHQIL